ncbi:universal stress protein [Fibrella aquatica]|uniref:universal stress protein n=1 Tax=Fibrella aquatica TaxID=3242487 RepID=UPI00351FADE8
MYKILLLTDFSAASRHAVAFTQTLFADTATDFCFVNTFQLLPEQGYGAGILLAEEREIAEETLAKFKLLMTKPPVPAHHTYRTMAILGEPESAVKELLTQEPFDLVVVGATGSGFSEFFGSVATGLIRSAETNVLVVPTSATIRPLAKLVLATDYKSVNDTASFNLLNDLAARKSAELTVLTIQNPQKADNEAFETSVTYVMQALDTVKTDRYTIHDEDVLSGIDTYLDTHTVDMLVLLPHHKSFFDVLRGTSISRTIAYDPRVPLLALYDATAEPTPSTASQTIDVIPFI